MSMFSRGKHSPRARNGSGAPRKRFRTLVTAGAGIVGLTGFAFIGAAIAGTSANASPTTVTSPLYYTGQGIPVKQECDANNDAYLLFVFTGGSATDVQLHGITVNDTKTVKGSVHFTTPYVDPPSSLDGKVNVTWNGDAGKHPQLVISHGCSGTNGGGSSSVPPSSPPPGCVTLSTSNVGQYGSLVWTGLSATVTLKQRDGGYCNDWPFDVTRYAPEAFPQTVQQVSSASVGKSGLSATAKVDAFTCGQDDGYEGNGPAVGSTLQGPGKDYEANHKFLSQIFGGPNTWTQVSEGCNTSTPPSQPQGSANVSLVCSSLQGGKYYQVKVDGSWSGFKPKTQYVVDVNGSGGAVVNTPPIETDAQGNLVVNGTFDEELAQRGFVSGQATLFIVEQGQNTPAFSEQVDIPAPDCAPASSGSSVPPTSGSPSSSHGKSTTTTVVKPSSSSGIGTGVSATRANGGQNAPGQIVTGKSGLDDNSELLEVGIGLLGAAVLVGAGGAVASRRRRDEAA